MGLVPVLCLGLASLKDELGDHVKPFTPEKAKEIIMSLQQPAIFCNMVFDWPAQHWTAKHLSEVLQGKQIRFRMGLRSTDTVKVLPIPKWLQQVAGSETMVGHEGSQSQAGEAHKWPAGHEGQEAMWQFETACSYVDATLEEFLAWNCDHSNVSGPFKDYDRSKFWAYADYKYFVNLFEDKTDVFQMKEEDVLKFLAVGTHLGGTNLDFQMSSTSTKGKATASISSIWRGPGRSCCLQLGLLLPLRTLLAGVSTISSRSTGQRAVGQRAVLKFAAATGATRIAGHFTPGTFTNQTQAAFREPQLLVVTDPRAEPQPPTEAFYVNLPTIAPCNTDSPLRYVDIAIPCNNKGAHSVGLMWWMLAQKVLRMHGTIFCEHPWEIMPDLYFYRDPEEIEKEEQAAAKKAVTKEEFQGKWTAPAPEFTAAQPEMADRSEGVQLPSVPIQQFPTEDWSAQPATEDWSAAPIMQATEWVGATTEWS
ncbi:hypothetical protein U0070_013674 [Myodes glareolus]|uniref:40S ribosomal protein SA n=1 Tax=Myodes glareolus TaxID=447135 RepID=A0AAW0JLY0_MYOGA